LSIQKLDNGNYGVIFVQLQGQQCLLEFQISRGALLPGQEADTASPEAKKVTPTTSGSPAECPSH
jgi:hypothetical protein